jgi:hypothetical protein
MQIFSNDALTSNSHTTSDEFGDIGIKQVFALVGLSRKEPVETRKQKIERFKCRAKKMSTVQFLRPLEKAAEATNQRMEKEKIPLRISCYRKEKRVLLEVTLPEKSLIRDITDDDFSKWVHNITEAKGLLIDN